MAKLLIIDDDEKQRESISEAALDAGFTKDKLLFAESETEANQQIEDHEVQLAIVDIMLTPERKEEGLRVIRRLRSKQPLCRVIALTTKVGNESGIRALKAGAHDFVSARWPFINWRVLLTQRIALWKGVIEENASAMSLA